MPKQTIMRKTLLVIIPFLIILFACNKESSKTVDSLKGNYKESEIYNELIRREAEGDKSLLKDTVPVPLNERLVGYDVDTLFSYLKGIYGDDDRHNLYEPVVTNDLKYDAEKVACIIKKDRIKQNEDGTFSLIVSQLYGEANGLCSTENFVNEPIVPFCSGFAVSNKLFVTAGHCVDNTNLNDILIIYGYRMKSKLEANIEIDQGDIYEPVRILKREFEGTSNDYSVLEIRQTFRDNRIASFRKNGKISDNENVHVIGYPSGLPIKVTLNAKVYNNRFSNYFVINSDTYQGNSGSPVFNSADHTVEGILVRGEKDFRYVRLSSCYGSVRCPKDIGTCRGEDVSRVSQFISHINNQQ
jgi:hypothetical protein